MQFKLAAFTTLFAAATLASATASPAKRFGDDPSYQCLTGKLLCCNSVQPTSNPIPTLLAGLVGAVLDGVTGDVGVTCSPVSVIAGAGTSCTQQSTCCTDNSFNGVIAVGCTPVNGNA